MSQNTTRRPKRRRSDRGESPNSAIIVNQPMVRNFSTGGGHGPEDTLIEGDDKIVDQEVAGLPAGELQSDRQAASGDAGSGAAAATRARRMYATRVLLPEHAVLQDAGQPASSRDGEVDRHFQGGEDAGSGVHPDAGNAPKTYPMPEELFFQGEVVAIVAAETEDQAEDAIVRDRGGVRNSSFGHEPAAGHGAEPAGPEQQATGEGTSSRRLVDWGDVDKASRRRTWSRSSATSSTAAIPFPFQPLGCVAKWDGDKLTMWGMTQRTYSTRRLAKSRDRSRQSRLRTSYDRQMVTGTRFATSTSGMAERSAERSERCDRSSIPGSRTSRK